MSTNNYPEGLPDVSALERLANQFFSALPGSAQAPPAAAVGGAGIPAAAFSPSGATDLRDHKQADDRLTETEHIPASVAGSGI